MLKNMKGFISVDVIKIAFSAMLGAMGSYVGLYHAVNDNSHELELHTERVKRIDQDITHLKGDLYQKLDTISQDIVTIKVNMAAR